MRLTQLTGSKMGNLWKMLSPPFRFYTKKMYLQRSSEVAWSEPCTMVCSLCDYSISTFVCLLHVKNCSNVLILFIHSVDATRETGRLGRLLNHSRTEANCATRLISIKERPYLILETIKDVKEGEELMYDYGERSKDIIHSHPWLKR